MKIIDLFCGAGGLSLGFESVGFESVLAIDKWEDAIETYNYNHSNSVGTTVDIHDFTNESLLKYKEKGVVGIIGGPPCQGFSLVGSRKCNDPRNSLYMEYVRFVSVIEPEFFVLENVSGLLSMDKGKYKEDIITRFEELGYDVTFKLLTASDYGVPQSRKRVFFIGLKKEKYKMFDFSNLKKQRVITTKEAISDLHEAALTNGITSYTMPAITNYQKEMRKNSKGLSNHQITKHTEQTTTIISLVPDGGSIKDLAEEYYTVRNYNATFRRMSSDLPSNTIDCGHRNYFHYSENRVPTVRESARIQSFPDDYIFKGSKTSQYTQVGNAVPPLLSKIIANELKKILKNKR